MPPKKKKVKVAPSRANSPPHLTIPVKKKYSDSFVNGILAKHGIAKIKIKDPTWPQIKSHCEMNRASISRYHVEGEKK